MWDRNYLVVCRKCGYRDYGYPDITVGCPNCGWAVNVYFVGDNTIRAASYEAFNKAMHEWIES